MSYFKNPGSMDPIAWRKIEESSPNWVRGGFTVFRGLVRVSLVLIEPEPDFLFFDIHFSTPVKWFNGPIMVILKIPQLAFPSFSLIVRISVFLEDHFSLYGWPSDFHRYSEFSDFRIIICLRSMIRIFWFSEESFAVITGSKHFLWLKLWTWSISIRYQIWTYPF